MIRTICGHCGPNVTNVGRIKEEAEGVGALEVIAACERILAEKKPDPKDWKTVEEFDTLDLS
jgi:hypothetical protein